MNGCPDLNPDWSEHSCPKCLPEAFPKPTIKTVKMKLSQLTPQDKLKLAAELCCDAELAEKMSCSYDVIITTIQKHWRKSNMEFMNGITFGESLKAVLRKKGNDQQCLPYNPSEHDIIATIAATPSQLLDALLVATGKAEL